MPTPATTTPSPPRAPRACTCPWRTDDVAERTAILTGVTGGWGRAVLDRFLERGWNVCGTKRAAGAGLPAGLLVVAADLTDPPPAGALGAAAARPSAALVAPRPPARRF